MIVALCVGLVAIPEPELVAELGGARRWSQTANIWFAPEPGLG